MTTNHQLQIAIANTGRFNSLQTARNAAQRQTYWVPVLLGDDAKFWVPATNREAGLLIKAGYEKA